MELETFAPDFSLLPAHIVTHILQFLNLSDFINANTVCKSWYYASTDPKIERTLAIQLNEQNFPIVCRSNRKYGGLKLINFDNHYSYYEELFEKFGPFIRKLQIFNCHIKLHQFLKLLEYFTCLEIVSFYECSQLEWLPGLFPLDYDVESKTRVIQNLAGLKNIEFVKIRSIPLIADFVQCTKNLVRLEIYNEYYGSCYKDFFTIFDNYNASSLKHLHLDLRLSGFLDDFIVRFIKIDNLNLKSCGLHLRWEWESRIYKGSLFRQFIIKLCDLEELTVGVLRYDQLLIISKYLKNLKSLDCALGTDQPISELENLKQLEKLRYGVPRTYYEHYRIENVIEIDKFFKCTFEKLRVFHFEEFITEQNLAHLCENHPNLIELKLACLLTSNLEIIFKHLTKLRLVDFGFKWLKPGGIKNLSHGDSNQKYEYKLSRLHDLEVFHLSELISGIQEDDVLLLKKLKVTNLPELFEKRAALNCNVTYDENLIFEDAKEEKPIFDKKCNVL